MEGTDCHRSDSSNMAAALAFGADSYHLALTKALSEALNDQCISNRTAAGAQLLFVGYNAIARVVAAAGGARDNQRSQAEPVEVVPSTNFSSLLETHSLG
ncbi:hypothetical protein PoB_005943100 [Plakobranchus ocellatus]|uniref:Uncharacterized protein n=1 Tax=Plakobranchus ocellatus TaxID=259542 RepID=A0AAV4CM78_9GAST|nr:hypothetical protein PoB_005943100 [Plakobranchus ocellatus]